MRSRRPFYTVACLAGLLALAGVRTAPADGEKPQASSLACRIMNYGKFQASAWEHMRSIGLNYVFIAVPPPAEVQAMKEKLAAHGLKVVVARGEVNLSTPDGWRQAAPQFEALRDLGGRYMFLSPKHPGATKEEACDRLRQAGELAQKFGIILVLETHPDLGTNGDEHVRTMQRINHPNVRVNFDTGNISFYNKGLNAVDELKKVLPYLATVEIKDHNGQFKTWNFPALGRGVVDIPGVLKVLKEHGYTGPVTMEVEGVQGAPWDEAQTKQNIAESTRYMQSQGSFR
jgi:L-ribulose-5-phosphate 3-epimerase